MAKSNKTKQQLAFDPITNKILIREELPWEWVTVTDPTTGQAFHQKQTKSEYDGLSIIWKDNTPFYATLKVIKVNNTYSGSAYATLVNVKTGEEYNMYSTEFNEAVGIAMQESTGFLEGNFVYKQKGSRILAIACV